MGFKITAIVIICIIAAYNFWITYLCSKSVKNEIPDNVKDIYDQEKYETWRNYRKEKIRLSQHITFGLQCICIVCRNISEKRIHAAVLSNTFDCCIGYSRYSF